MKSNGFLISFPQKTLDSNFCYNIQGIHGRGYESNRNDLQLMLEKRNTNEEVIFDVRENPDLNDARGEEPKAEPIEAGVSGVSNKRKRR